MPPTPSGGARGASAVGIAQLPLAQNGYAAQKGRPALASSRHSSDSMDKRVTVAAFLQRRRNQRSSNGIDGADGETSLTCP
jgi:hypothetical protein